MVVKERRQVVRPVLAKELPAIDEIARQFLLGEEKQYGRFINISNVKFSSPNVINLDSLSFTSWHSFNTWVNDNYDVGFKLDLFYRNGKLSFSPTSEQIGVVVVSKNDVLEFFGGGERVTSTKINEIRIKLYEELKKINASL